MTQNRQVLEGVNKSVLLDAIHSMIGQNVILNKEKLFSGKIVRVASSFSGIHRVRAQPTNDSEYTITVESIAKLA